MASNLQTHPVACVTCKTRKVKCDRILPKCGRCRAYDIDCVYVERQVKTPKPPRERGTKIESLLARLTRIESTVHAQAVPPQYGRSRSAPDVQAYLPSPASAPQSASPEGQQQSASRSPSSDNSKANPDGGAAVQASLQDAVERFAGTKLRKMFHATRISQGFHIPCERAKLWIKNYFESLPANMNPGCQENADLLRLLPELIDQEYVHVDPGIIAIYFLVLYHGSCLSHDEAAKSDVQSAYMLALRALPSWQRSAAGSSLDLSVAMMMSRAAIQCYDVYLGYQMHCLACDYAEGLDIQKMDVEEVSSALGPGISRTDTERRRFWDLVQYDAYFRLMLNKPSAMSTPMNAWRVDLPYLNSGLAAGESAIMFLFSSRLTLELARFFQLLDGSADGDVDQQMLLTEVETLCRNMRERYDEWQIDKVLASTQMTQADGRLVADGAIAGLMSIILMLRSIGAAYTPLSIETSRHVLRTLDRTLSQGQSPTLAITSLGFFSLMAFVPYATVAEQVAGADNFENGDMTLLEKLKDVVVAICKDEVDFLPLARAMQKACEYARNGRRLIRV